MSQELGEITRLLRKVREGDKIAEQTLLDNIYAELHRLAERYHRFERPNHTLQPTALINEAFVHLANQWGKDWQNRAHFFGVAAQVMRRVLVEYGRAYRADKRSGAHEQISLDIDLLLSPQRSAEILMLDEALNRLSAFDARQSRIVELRFFGGLTEEETAELWALACTIQREWRMAKAWLYSELNAQKM